jgi:hypothetical protein
MLKRRKATSAAKDAILPREVNSCLLVIEVN